MLFSWNNNQESGVNFVKQYLNNGCGLSNDIFEGNKSRSLIMQ